MGSDWYMFIVILVIVFGGVLLISKSDPVDINSFDYKCTSQNGTPIYIDSKLICLSSSVVIPIK